MDAPSPSDSGELFLSKATEDLGEPVVITHFSNLQLAHLAVSRLEAEGFVAMVEPSNVSRGFVASFAAQPLGIGVVVPASQAEAAYRHLQAAGLLPTSDSSPSRLVLQARDGMWMSAATIPAFFLAPLAYFWALSTRRELTRVRDEMTSEDYQLAWRRVTRAKWFALVGTLIFAAIVLIRVLLN